MSGDEADDTQRAPIDLDGADVEWDETELVQERPTIDQWTTAMPQDAQRVGLDQTTPEGQMVGFFSGLQGGGRRAKFVAWAFIILFIGPILLSIVLDLF